MFNLYTLDLSLLTHFLLLLIFCKFMLSTKIILISMVIGLVFSLFFVFLAMYNEMISLCISCLSKLLTAVEENSLIFVFSLCFYAREMYLSFFVVFAFSYFLFSFFQI